MSATKFLSKAFTVINPTKSLKSYLTSRISNAPFTPVSVILSATPDHASSLWDLGSELNGLQVIGVSVDSIPPADQRSAFSAFLCSKTLKIADFAPLDDQHSHPNSSGGRQNWSLPMSFFSFNLTRTNGLPSTVVLPAASTLFTRGTESTMFFTDDKGIHQVSSLNLSFPSNGLFSPIDVSTPLRKIGQELTITSSAKNMIKTINDTSAASFLEKAPELLESESEQDRKVFAEVISAPPFSSSSRYEVIAGGGGSWSPRSAMLVLEPRANLQAGDKIQFYMSLPAQSSDIASEASEVLSNCNFSSIALECSTKTESAAYTGLVTYKEDTIIENVFGLGSEAGFLVDEQRHAVPGEFGVSRAD